LVCSGASHEGVATSKPGTVKVKPSAIEGLGSFACGAFGPGEQIHRVIALREITAEAPLRPDLGERFDHCDYPDGKMVLIGFPSRHLDHSRGPNAYLHCGGDACFVVARRRVATGEEVTIDHNINISGGTAWPCHRAARRCLGSVLGDFFLLPPELQSECLPLLAGWFVGRHAHRLAAPQVAAA
jgi:hypothetical protein